VLERRLLGEACRVGPLPPQDLQQVLGLLGRVVLCEQGLEEARGRRLVSLVDVLPLGRQRREGGRRLDGACAAFTASARAAAAIAATKERNSGRRVSAHAASTLQTALPAPARSVFQSRMAALWTKAHPASRSPRIFESRARSSRVRELASRATARSSEGGAPRACAATDWTMVRTISAAGASADSERTASSRSYPNWHAVGVEGLGHAVGVEDIRLARTRGTVWLRISMPGIAPATVPVAGNTNSGKSLLSGAPEEDARSSRSTARVA